MFQPQRLRTNHTNAIAALRITSTRLTWERHILRPPAASEPATRCRRRCASTSRCLLFQQFNRARPSVVTGIFTTMPGWRYSVVWLLPPSLSRRGSWSAQIKSAFFADGVLQLWAASQIDSLLAATMLGLVVTPASENARQTFNFRR